VPHNSPLQRFEIDKVLGRGRGYAATKQLLRALVLTRQWPPAERGR
jgi:hypothetical protein